MNPIGLEGHTRNYSAIKMFHKYITLHQDAYPELKEMMRNNSNASKVYAAFLLMMPLEARGRLTPLQREEILKRYGLR